LFGAALEEFKEYLVLVDIEESWVKGKLFITFNVEREAPDLLRGRITRRICGRSLANGTALG
jgi:hypothetical protein